MEFDLEVIHLGTLLITAIFIVIADHDGFLYMRGKKQTLDSARVIRLHYAVMTGLLIMIGTGAFMALPEWDRLIAEPAFIVKMFMVGALIANSHVIGSLMHIATEKPFATLVSGERIKLYLSGGISILCWLGAFIVGFFFL